MTRARWSMRAPSASARGRSGVSSKMSSTAWAAARASGLPPNVPPRAPTPGESMSSARPMTAPSGRPAAIDLAVTRRSGTRSKCSQAKNRPVRPMPLCTSSAMIRMPWRRQSAASLPKYSSGGTTKPPSPRTGSTITAAIVAGSAYFLKCSSMASTHATLQSGYLQVVGAAVAVRVGHPHNLADHRRESPLIGIDLARERHRQQRAAVERVLEAQHGGPAGRMPRDLDGILDRFGAAVEEHRFLRERARCPARQAFSQRDVELVRAPPKSTCG